MRNLLVVAILLTGCSVFAMDGDTFTTYFYDEEYVNSEYDPSNTEYENTRAEIIEQNYGSEYSYGYLNTTDPGFGGSDFDRNY